MYFNVYVSINVTGLQDVIVLNRISVSIDKITQNNFSAMALICWHRNVLPILVKN